MYKVYEVDRQQHDYGMEMVLVGASSPSDAAKIAGITYMPKLVRHQVELLRGVRSERKGVLSVYSYYE